MANFNVLGDSFSIIKQGMFKSINVSWYVLEAGTEQRIVVIPVSYGEDKIRNLLETRYLYNFAKDPMTNNFYVNVKNIPDEAIYNELNNL